MAEFSPPTPDTGAEVLEDKDRKGRVSPADGDGVAQPSGGDGGGGGGVK